MSSGALFIRWIGNCTIKTHIIFCITRTVNYTRPRPSSASQKLGNRRDQHHLQNHKNWELDKTHTIFSITILGKQTRHTYMFNIKSSRCYYSHHHRHYHNPQLKAVSFVGTVETVGVVVTHIILVDNISRLCTSNSPLDTRTPMNCKQIAFIITCIHLHRHCIDHYLHFDSPMPSLHSSFIVIFIHLHHHCQAPFS